MTESSDRKGDWESVFLCLGDKTTVRTTALSLARKLSQSTRLVVRCKCLGHDFQRYGFYVADSVS